MLITAMSGVGKSSVLAELTQRGDAVVDTDHDGFCDEETLPDGRIEQRWTWLSSFSRVRRHARSGTP